VGLSPALSSSPSFSSTPPLFDWFRALTRHHFPTLALTLSLRLFKFSLAHSRIFGVARSALLFLLSELTARLTLYLGDHEANLWSETVFYLTFLIIINIMFLVMRSASSPLVPKTVGRAYNKNRFGHCTTTFVTIRWEESKDQLPNNGLRSVQEPKAFPSPSTRDWLLLKLRHVSLNPMRRPPATTAI
jgi:hypothetical protein